MSCGGGGKGGSFPQGPTKWNKIVGPWLSGSVLLEHISPGPGVQDRIFLKVCNCRYLARPCQTLPTAMSQDSYANSGRDAGY